MFFCKLQLPSAIPITQTLQSSAQKVNTSIQTSCQNSAEALANHRGLNDTATPALCKAWGKGRRGDECSGCDNSRVRMSRRGTEQPLVAWNRHEKRPPVQSTGMDSVGRVDVINHSSHMASAQNQQEMFGCEHDQGHDPCAHEALGGGMVFSDLSTGFIRFEQSKFCWRAQLC